MAALSTARQSSGDEARRPGRPQKESVKKGRKWGPDGIADEDDGAILDYSAISPGLEDGPPLQETISSAVMNINADSFGTRTGKGQFVLKDLDDEVHSILNGANAKKDDQASSGLVGSGLTAISGMFRNIIGGKVLTDDDVNKAMRGMEEHLIKKNVAREAAVRLCEGLRCELVGVKTGNFESEVS